MHFYNTFINCSAAYNIDRITKNAFKQMITDNIASLDMEEHEKYKESEI